MSQFIPVTGMVTSISTMPGTTDDRSGCTLMFALLLTGTRNTVNFVVSSDTYVLDQATIRRGDTVTAFYDAMAPVPLIYPPQYRAVLLLKNTGSQFAAFDYFDQNLTNSDQTLRLIPSSTTAIHLSNGQTFLGSLGNQYLLALYTATTRSIPAQTTPSRIIVFCTAT